MDKMYRFLFIVLVAVISASTQVYYSQGFEGKVDMTVTGTGWEFGVPTYASGPLNVPEGSKCAGTVLNGSYDSYAAYELTSPSITLPDSSNISLSFYEWSSIETCCDHLYLEIERDSSNSWTSLRSTSPNTSAWNNQTFDLSSYRKSKIRLRFRLTSDGSINYAGWYIDDIRVYTPVRKSLTITNDGNGTTSPTGATLIDTAILNPISATPNAGYRFSNWGITNGTVSIGNSALQSTMIQISTDAIVKANFIAGTVYNVTSSPVSYNYNANYYDVTPSNGVRFKFTAPSSGSYSIALQNVLSHYNYLYYYGRDSLFSTSVSNQYNSSTVSYALYANAGESYYFKVVPSASSYWTYNFNISYSNALTLNITNDGHGTTTPAGNIAALSTESKTITAIPMTGYRFVNWTVESGSASIVAPTSLSTTVQASTNATIKANFALGELYSLTSTPATYNFTNNYYEINPSNGIRFKFIAPSAGNYSIVIDSSYKYLYYYGTSSSFSTSQYSTYSSSRITYNFTASASGETHYFKISPYSLSYNSNNISISVQQAALLTLTTNGSGGTVSPSSAVLIPRGSTYLISASPYSGYRFQKWTIVNGTATLTDSLSASPTVQVLSDATVRANFIAGTVYNVTSSPVSYNYNANYYDVTPSNGVRFKFIAPASGSYALNLQNAISHSNTLYCYGRDSLFNSYTEYRSNSTSVNYAFHANAGESYYFKVVTSSSSYWNYNFNLSYSNALTLNVTNDGHGTTSPAGNTSVLSTEARTITATPSAGYRFVNWTSTSGSASFASSSSMSTTVQISNDETVRANFIAGTVYNVTSSPVSYNYNTNYYDVTPSNGVRFKFIAPASGSYALNLQNAISHSNTLYSYGRDSLFNSYTEYRSNSTSVNYAFYANAGESYYFKVVTSSSSYWSYNFNISYSNALTLNVTNDGHGTTSPAGNTGVLSTEARTITATPSAGYRFVNWSVENGSATVANTTSMSTTVQTSSNATIKANFTTGSIYSLSSAIATFNFTNNYYEISPSSGIRFQFIAPTAGNFSIIVDSAYFNLYCYGTNSSFATPVYSSSYTSHLTYNFTASTAGETYYFKVIPYSSSYWTNNISASVQSLDSLTLSTNGVGGTVTPAGAVAIPAVLPYSISASPQSGYRFKSWTILNGTATITDSTAKSTTVRISSNTSISANFIPGTVYTLTNTPTLYNFTNNYYEVDPGNGVRFEFRAPTAGTYCIVVDSSSKYLYDYGTSSSFSSSIWSQSGSSRIAHSFTASAAGEVHYFKVVPSGSTYYTSNFAVSVKPSAILVIQTDGRGFTSPADTVRVFSGVDTLVKALPNGGFKFSNWSAISGSASFSRLDTSATRVTVSSDTAIIKASFMIDPNVRPDVEISDINISSHPSICVTTSVTDSSGRSLVGLDSSSFILTQDSDTLNYQLTTVSRVSGVSVALVIDKSGSMSGTLPTAINAALQFVKTMGPLDRCAIVSFDDVVRVEQAITSDTVLLNSAINRIALGNNTAIYNGAYTGIQQLLQETNTRAVIIYSDGSDNSSTYSQANVRDLARQNHTPIYSIGLGTAADSTALKPIADSTGGYYTFAPSASDLAKIYSQIKNDVAAQYILCYQSPDVIFNGDTHSVEVSVKINGHTDKDTIFWSENNLPPVISLTAATNAMIGTNQPTGNAITISADVTDDGAINKVRLFYRTSNRTVGSYTELQMTQTSGTTFQATIPAAGVMYPGIDFYILADDNYHLIGRSPNVLVPETQPYVIPVANEVPSIVHSADTCIPVGQNHEIRATITDNDGTFYAVLFYKKDNETFFTADTMREISSSIYSASIPQSVIVSNGIDYYIRAVDNVGAAARYPQSGNFNLPLCNNSDIPIANAGTDQAIYLTNGCTANVTLNGTASRDPEGKPMTYSWTGPLMEH